MSHKSSSSSSKDAQHKKLDRHVLRKYQVDGVLGKGAYGIVWKAITKSTSDVVAIKKCFGAFRNSTDAQRTYREIMYLKKLRGHEHIVQLIGLDRSESDQDIYVITEWMETDLHAVIRANILEDIHKQFLIYQLVKVLKFLHTGDCHMKLCDFGLCRSLHEAEVKVKDEPTVLTDYVATRWYRAPEILLGSTNYSMGVDMWAVGCLLGEMLLGSPLFPGKSTLNQLERIVAVTGRPSQEDLATLRSPFAATMLRELRIPRTRTLETMVPSASKDGIDLMSKCLQFNPSKRPTADELLKHPFLAKFHNADEEPSSPDVISIPIDDNTKYSASDYRRLLLKEVSSQKTAARKESGGEPSKRRSSSRGRSSSKGRRPSGEASETRSSSKGRRPSGEASETRSSSKGRRPSGEVSETRSSSKGRRPSGEVPKSGKLPPTQDPVVTSHHRTGGSTTTGGPIGARVPRHRTSASMGGRSSNAHRR